MNISLTPQLEKYVHSRVKSGRYGSASEVMRAGLRILQEYEKSQERRLKDLRREIDLGLSQLDRGERIPAEDVFSELRERNQRARRKAKSA